MKKQCKIWGGSLDKDGYAVYNKRNKDGVWKQYRVSRIILRQKLGRRLEKGCVAMHTCDNPSCVEPTHLKEGTHRDNMLDCIRKGRHNRTVLNEEKVRKIVKLHNINKKYYTCIRLGNLFGVDYSAISKILRGVSWSHLWLDSE